ncbi:unnamed protein product [Trypanosoma congolense IL3000]|uniref:WGS project CAEQ00000000 data, annotated contig 1713 n=1 Tax=Trypanosoma congolense (strain IL3000) TaxID=1068625 RepID=F9W879_TRYCI|nr:unnamed protein product [Trypanosoma congolense IL3000]
MKIPGSLLRRVGRTRVAPRLIISEPLSCSLALQLVKLTESRTLSSATLVPCDAALQLPGSEKQTAQRLRLQAALSKSRSDGAGCAAPKRAVKRPQQPPTLGANSAMHLNKQLSRRKKESDGSVEGGEPYSNEVTAPAAVPQLPIHTHRYNISH